MIPIDAPRLRFRRGLTEVAYQKPDCMDVSPRRRPRSPEIWEVRHHCFLRSDCNALGEIVMPLAADRRRASAGYFRGAKEC